ncbi:hypothetical protein FISHEDRAFT_69317 [Fistulina hepatica ATCC 64428]|uniref:DUF6534 domain-containing protein n=1 Tax=Fistulina hepatica ATCC 64428 TaxID=1128425 RepID=A0A0D7APY5_9AGAR|nr:hypothetical protein FISHEDRAFT_69317 [Fistulina hepatica ATCC 64428]
MSTTGDAALASTAAPLLTGYIMNAMLYGCLLMQLCTLKNASSVLVEDDSAAPIDWYYMSFPRDPRFLKLFAGVLFCLETAQTALIIYDALESFTLAFGDVDELNKVHSAWMNIPIMTGVVSSLVHIFFCWRIYSLSKNWISIAVVMTFSLCQLTTAIYTGTRVYHIGEYSLLQATTQVPCSIWLASSAVTDMLIAIAMCYHLWRIPKSFRRTELLISRLIRSTVETGSITAIFAIILVVLYTSLDNGSYYACMGAMLAKLYSNVALAVLNSRIRILNGRERADTTDAFIDLDEEPHSQFRSTISASNQLHTRINYTVDVQQSYSPSETGKVGEVGGHAIPLEPLGPYSANTENMDTKAQSNYV